ncbi:hypothetical protein [Pseudodesulfovibrio sediminis]|uniref:Uncharacterized protein n=1 Tax=Pseudodesulfovibrio sediminis TaxID=2810563 RepID=A0ABM7P8J1_9BACT|nr:hypothetical protein [Pseudodesulfovibrio sediminis]BCS89751.1 hypothetical protein PSDVSF_29930 [Pseudodesulfovibrio sediminis]
MIYNKKEFYGGAVLLIAFFVVLYLMFQPMFSGHNAMEYLDNLYNSISKGSVYYIPALKEEVAPYANKQVSMDLAYDTEIEASQSALLFTRAGAQAQVAGNTLRVSGSLGGMLNTSLADAEAMYHNDGKTITARYDLEPRRAMFNWWTSLKLMDKSLKSHREFAAAKVIGNVGKKAVEASYNYFKVEPVQIMDQIGMVVFSLAFYVFYTLWYGFAILFLFEGWGLKLSH